jgi:diaphanous 1
LYLKRALESVYTRFQSREEDRADSRDAEIDAELMAARTIERLAQKDDQISSLCLELTDLKARLAAKPKSTTDPEFKAISSPTPSQQK